MDVVPPLELLTVEEVVSFLLSGVEGTLLEVMSLLISSCCEGVEDKVLLLSETTFSTIEETPDESVVLSLLLQPIKPNAKIKHNKNAATFIISEHCIQEKIKHCLTFY